MNNKKREDGLTVLFSTHARLAEQRPSIKKKPLGPVTQRPIGGGGGT